MIAVLHGSFSDFPMRLGAYGPALASAAAPAKGVAVPSNLPSHRAIASDTFARPGNPVSPPTSIGSNWFLDGMRNIEKSRCGPMLMWL